MGNPGRIIIASFLIILGASALFNVDLWRIFWPLLLVFLGVRILTGGNRVGGFDRPEESTEAYLDYSAVFAGLDKKVVSAFKGGKINVVFGGGTLDLRESTLNKSETVNLEVNLVFGGLKILVPTTWLVSTSNVGVVGGFANNTRSPDTSLETGLLVIKGATVFGGGEVVN